MLGELRPSVALFENVPGLFVSNGGRFFNRILSDISESGYDAEWQIISAQDLGAPHLRKRIWIVAYSQEQYRPVKRQETPIAGRSSHDVANTEGRRKQELPKRDNRRETQIGHGAGTSGGSRRGDTSERVIGSRRITPEVSADVSYSDSQRCEEQFNAVTGGSRNTDGPDCGNMADTDPRQRKHGGEIYAGTMTEEFGERYCNEWWAVEPNVGRVAHGIPFRMDRLKGIGNSVVPWCVNKILLLPAFDRWRR
jgi:DNA (cytosine-5)-methyltransferase 1